MEDDKGKDDTNEVEIEENENKKNKIKGGRRNERRTIKVEIEENKNTIKGGRNRKGE